MPTAMEMNEALLRSSDEPAAEAKRPKTPAKEVRHGECGACGRQVALVESGGKTVIELHSPRVVGKTEWRTCPTSGREVD